MIPQKNCRTISSENHQNVRPIIIYYYLLLCLGPGTAPDAWVFPLHHHLKPQARPHSPWQRTWTWATFLVWITATQWSQNVGAGGAHHRSHQLMASSSPDCHRLVEWGRHNELEASMVGVSSSHVLGLGSLRPRCAHSHRPSGKRKIVIATSPSRR